MEKSNPKCRLHPTESITNYCLQVGCFTELCAACICDHTQAHNRLNTKPKYELIKKAYLAVNQNIDNVKDMLNHEKSRVTVILDKISKQKSDAYKILKQARQEALATVHRAFDELEIHYDNHLQQEKQKTGLLNETRLNQIYSDLNHQSVELFNLYQELSTHSNPKLIRSICTEILPETRNYIMEISKELASNECFHPALSYIPSNLQSITTAIKKLFTTSVSYSIGTMPASMSNSHEYFNRTARSISKGREVLNAVRVINIQPHTNNTLNNRQASLRKSSTCIRPALQTKSPKFNQAGLTLTSKQNFFPTASEEYQSKPFAHTYS